MAQSDNYIRELAIKSARQRLALGATFAELHADKPLFKKTMRQRDGKAVLVRLDWPGVLRIFDPATGELLAESEAGKPYQLTRLLTLGAIEPAKNAGDAT